MGIISRGFSVASKKAVLGIAVFAVVGFIIFILHGAPKSQSSHVAAIGEATSAQSSDLLNDPDHDGLPNWQEEIFRTDQNNPDTDGDGVLDGDEIGQGRDPLVKGVGDLTSRSQDLASSDGALTSELAKAVVESGAIGNYMGGGSADVPNNYVARVDQIYSDTIAKEIETTKKDLRYSADGSNTAIKNYLNAVASIYESHFGKFTKLDFEILADALKSSDTKHDLSGLDPYITAADQSVRDLIKLEAPLPLRDFHERGVALLVETRFELTAMKNLDSDAALSLYATGQRMQTRVNFAKLYSFEIADWIKQKNIAFAQSESASRIFGI
jgi:hypothetical protein